MPDRQDRHIMPEPGSPIFGRAQIRHPDNTPDWLVPYEVFLAKYAPTVGSYWGFKMRLEFCADDLELLLPGDSEGVTINPRLIQMSLRVQWLLFQRLFPREGAYVLFRQVAYCEFWRRYSLLIWPILWLADKPRWARKAEARAEDLLWIWEQNEIRPSHKPKKPLLEP